MALLVCLFCLRARLFFFKKKKLAVNNKRAYFWGGITRKFNLGAVTLYSSTIENRATLLLYISASMTLLYVLLGFGK
jgi:hypothetical protein